MTTPRSGPHGGTILTEERSSSLLVLYTDWCITCPLYTVQTLYTTREAALHHESPGQDTSGNHALVRGKTLGFKEKHEWRASKGRWQEQYYFIIFLLNPVKIL